MKFVLLLAPKQLTFPEETALKASCSFRRIKRANTESGCCIHEFSRQPGLSRLNKVCDAALREPCTLYAVLTHSRLLSSRFNQGQRMSIIRTLQCSGNTYNRYRFTWSINPGHYAVLPNLSMTSSFPALTVNSSEDAVINRHIEAQLTYGLIKIFMFDGCTTSIKMVDLFQRN